MSPLTFEMMGFVALAAMWVNTVLILATIVADVWRAYRAIGVTGPVAMALAGGAGIAAAAIGVTTLALTQPLFGPVSTVGGALGLAYFLLVQPAGVMLRESLMPLSADTRVDADGMRS